MCLFWAKKILFYILIYVPVVRSLFYPFEYRAAVSSLWTHPATPSAKFKPPQLWIVSVAKFFCFWGRYTHFFILLFASGMCRVPNDNLPDGLLQLPSTKVSSTNFDRLQLCRAPCLPNIKKGRISSSTFFFLF